MSTMFLDFTDNSMAIGIQPMCKTFEWVCVFVCVEESYMVYFCVNVLQYYGDLEYLVK